MINTLIEFLVIEEISFVLHSKASKWTNNVVELSTREFELLRYLMDNAGIALSKEQIFTSVWGDSYGDIGAVAVNIKSLRDKIGEKYIVTIWGYGYKFIRVESDEKC